jgi:hypothetical protein
MLRLLPAVSVSIAVLVAGCRCAQGPGYIKEVTLTSDTSSILLTLPLHPEGDTGTYLSAGKTGLPQGLDAKVEGDVLRLVGTLAPGKYDFTVTLHEQQDNACANWARYDIALDVKGP